MIKKCNKKYVIACSPPLYFLMSRNYLTKVYEKRDNILRDGIKISWMVLKKDRILSFRVTKQNVDEALSLRPDLVAAIISAIVSKNSLRNWREYTRAHNKFYSFHQRSSDFVRHYSIARISRRSRVACVRNFHSDCRYLSCHSRIRQHSSNSQLLKCSISLFNIVYCIYLICMLIEKHIKERE